VTTSEEYRHPAYAYQRASYQYYNVSYVNNILLVDPFIPELGRATPTELARRFIRNLSTSPVTLGDGVTDGSRLWNGALSFVQQGVGVDLLPPWAGNIPIALVGFLTIVGLLTLMIQRQIFLVIYVLASFGLIYVTPWPGQFCRYMTPVTPILALALVQLTATVRYRWLRYRSRAVRMCALVASCLVIALVVVTEVGSDMYAYWFRETKGRTLDDGGRLFYYDHTWADYDAALAWLDCNASTDAVIATSAPHWLYLKIARRAVMPPMERDPSEAQRLLDSVPVTHVIVDELQFVDMTRRYARPALDGHPGFWKRIYSSPNGQTSIYQRIR
jgi:hypothetical protein